MTTALDPSTPPSASSLVLAREGGEAVPIVCSCRNESARLACAELARYLSRMARCRAGVTETRPRSGPAIELVCGGASRSVPDGFRRTVSASGIRLEAATGRGLLFGAYDLLEDLGCRWFYPGPVGERVPRLREARLPFGDKEATPALAGRSLILGHDLYLGDVAGWVEWAARNRLNGVFLHEFPPRLLGGRCAGYWREALVRALPAARRRGLTVEFGGHGLAALLPRSYFKSHPDYFRHDGRRRTPDHNFCPSSAGALDVVARNARAWFEAHRGVDVYHLWPDDIVGGGWCRCERCAGLSASDQTLLAINAVARALADVEPAARLAFLAYHDTVKPPVSVKPEPNVVMLFAPRERCYAHPLDDPGCEVNRSYHRDLLAGIAAAAAPGADTGPRVFEYHLDAFLFKSMVPVLSGVMARDLAAYRDAGVDTVGCLATSDRPNVAVPPNLWLWGRLGWNLRADRRALLEDFASGMFGQADLAGYIEILEKAFALVLELDGQPMGLRLPEGSLLDNPPADTLDFLAAPVEAGQRKAAQLAEAVGLVAEARRALAAARGLAAARAAEWALAALDDERKDLELVSSQLDFMLARQQVVLAAPGAPAAAEAAARAWRALRDIRAWSRRNLRGALARNQFLLVHAQWELQLLKLERKAGLRLRDLAALASIGWRAAALRLLASGRRPASAYHHSAG